MATIYSVFLLCCLFARIDGLKAFYPPMVLCSWCFGQKEKAFTAVELVCLFASFWVASSASSCRICEVERQPRDLTLKSFLWTQVPLPDCLLSTFQ